MNWGQWSGIRIRFVYIFPLIQSIVNPIYSNKGISIRLNISSKVVDNDKYLFLLCSVMLFLI